MDTQPYTIIIDPVIWDALSNPKRLEHVNFLISKLKEKRADNLYLSKALAETGLSKPTLIALKRAGIPATVAAVKCGLGNGELSGLVGGFGPRKINELKDFVERYDNFERHSTFLNKQ